MGVSGVFITGGAGFIGTSLAERLIARDRVVLFDNLSRNALAGCEFANHPNLTLVTGDVMDGAAVTAAMAGCDRVVHLAAIAGVDTVRKDPVRTMKVSLIGTYNVLEAALANHQKSTRINRLIDFSTSEVFGRYAYKVQEGDVTELGAVGEARWTYAVSKLATEHLTLSYQRQYGLPALSIRPFNIYGPRQVGEGAIHHFVVRAIAGEDLNINNDGAQIHSWCYIDDIVDGILVALDRPEAVGQAFNIGNPRATVTIYHLAQEIRRLASSSSAIRFVVHEEADVELRIPDVRKAERLLGYRPKVELEEGLLRTIQWYRRKR
ncbi:MAG: GDP-mannose 4,6-dehydratase [Deltaproteobacteria bacterium]|nr:GDP-mannose 4,6-dehydratase [Deltaproteobacteria bacterium]